MLALDGPGVGRCRARPTSTRRRLTGEGRYGIKVPTGTYLPAGPPLTSTPSEKTPSRVDRRVQEFRARVLKTAELLFIEQGVEATKIDQICEAADVAKRTLFNHFPTKADLVLALSRESVSRIVALVDEARRNGANNRERLRRLFDGLHDQTRDLGPVHPESVGAFFQVALGTSDGSEGEVRLSRAIRELIEAGGPEDLPANVSAETFAELVLGAIYSTTLEWVHRDDYDIERHTEQIGAFLITLLPDAHP